jgi:hypothetical protein
MATGPVLSEGNKRPPHLNDRVVNDNAWGVDPSHQLATNPQKLPSRLSNPSGTYSIKMSTGPPKQSSNVLSENNHFIE